MDQPQAVCRFAPTASGRAHPGTLLAGMLAWLDAKKNKARFILRMEDIDPDRVTDEWRNGLLDDFIWFGLTWDELIWQSKCKSEHEKALDVLAAKGMLYSCSCSRSDLRRAHIPSVSGGYVYPGTCREKRIEDWRNCKENIRCRIGDEFIRLTDESGLDLSQDVAAMMGDPVLRRKDGTITYQLAVVVDDHLSGVTRIIRGRDIADSTATQVALMKYLDFPIPQYRHHLLLLEPRGSKFAKFHGAVGADTLRNFYSPEELIGLLAQVTGFRPDNSPVSLHELTSDFEWAQVRSEDTVLEWDGKKLTWKK